MTSTFSEPVMSPLMSIIVQHGQLMSMLENIWKHIPRRGKYRGNARNWKTSFLTGCTICRPAFSNTPSLHQPRTSLFAYDDQPSTDASDQICLIIPLVHLSDQWWLIRNLCGINHSAPIHHHPIILTSTSATKTPRR